MKKALVAAFIVVLMLVLFFSFSFAEQTHPLYRINEVYYDGLTFHGNAVVPNDCDYYARVTIFWDNCFIVFVTPIDKDGNFVQQIAAPYDYYCVKIINQNSVAPPCEAYSWYCYTGG